jgi:hypothetical protein
MYNRWIAAAVTAVLLFFGSASVEAAPATRSRTGSTALRATWRWIETFNGYSGFRGTPRACGCERFLSLRAKGTYEFVEQDSAHEYLLASGSYAIHPGGNLTIEANGKVADFWISLDQWPEYHPSQLVWFVDKGRDTLLTYPGGPGFGVSDASTERYVRLSDRPNSARLRAHRTRLPLLDRPSRNEIDRLPLEIDFAPTTTPHPESPAPPRSR